MAKFSDKIKAFFSRKTLSMTSGENTEWSIRISMGGLLGGLIAFIVVLFALIMLLVAYTPVLDIFPGYRTAAERTHDELVQNIMRIDSLERSMTLMQQYSDNVAMVMVGRTPAVRSQISDTVKLDKTLVQPSQIDSVLRAQMEGDGEYSLSLNAAPRQRDGELFEAPVDGGSIVRHFSHKDNYLGIGVRVAPNSSVVSVGEGSVMDVFSAEAGYTTIVVQHYNGFVSIYHNLVQPLVSRGQTVRSGQVLGYNAMPKVGDEENPLFEMELWSDGKAVDPEIYMVF